MEPDKCYGWEWVQWQDVVAWGKEGESERELFLAMVSLLEQRKGFDPAVALKQQS